MTPHSANVDATAIAQSPGNSGTTPAPVDEVIAYENTIRLRVMFNIGRIGRAVREAVVRVRLAPLMGPSVTMVNVVAKRLFVAAIHIGPLF